MPLTVAVGSAISEEGFTLMMSPSAAASVWKTLVGQGAVPMGANAWETLRILRGKIHLKSSIWLFFVVLWFFMGILACVCVFFCNSLRLSDFSNSISLICSGILYFLKLCGNLGFSFTYQ